MEMERGFEVEVPASYVTVPMTGLNPLISLNLLAVKQTPEMLEAALQTVSIGYEGANKYRILDESGKEMYFVAEESGCCCRCCLAPNHSMTLHVTDMSGAPVLTMARPWPYNCCLLECGNCFGLNRMNVFLGNDVEDESKKIGSVRMPVCGGFFKPTLNFEDKNDEVVGSIVGPCCCIGDACGAEFDVKGPNGDDFGKVKKMGVSGLSDVGQELLTDADNFNISFPQQLPVEIKALAMGGLLLLDFMFFESGGSFEIDPCKPSCDVECCKLFCFGCVCPVKCKFDLSSCNEGGDDK